MSASALTSGAETPQPLFTPPPEGEEAWTLQFSLKGQELELPLHPSLIQREIDDQCELKSNHRKAVLRDTLKSLNRALKRGFETLEGRALEETQWAAFILLVDRVIDGRHLSLREDVAARKALAEDPRFRN